MDVDNIHRSTSYVTVWHSVSFITKRNIYQVFIRISEIKIDYTIPLSENDNRKEVVIDHRTEKIGSVLVAATKKQQNLLKSLEVKTHTLVKNLLSYLPPLANEWKDPSNLSNPWNRTFNCFSRAAWSNWATVKYFSVLS